MNHSPSRRFTNGLTSGLSLLALFAVGHALSGEVSSVMAADTPPASDLKTPQVNSQTAPSFKNLPADTAAITAKRVTDQSDPASETMMPSSPLAIDVNKGITSKATPERARVAEQGKEDLKERGDLQDFHATAYSIKGRTASGAYTRPGMIAADPRVLPMGTVVHIRAGRYTGTYTVTDTGGRIKGRKVDIYIPSYQEARQFGRQRIKIKVMGRSARKTGPARRNSEPADL